MGRIEHHPKNFRAAIVDRQKLVMTSVHQKIMSQLGKKESLMTNQECLDFIRHVLAFGTPNKTSVKQMSISERGKQLIKKFEGLVLHPYLDQAGLGTLGYGHLLSDKEKSSYARSITQEIAEDILNTDLAIMENHLRNLIQVPLNQNQYDAILSLTFNIGPARLAHSTLLKRINEHDWKAVKHEWHRFVYITTHSKNGRSKRLSHGLKTRRETEWALFSLPPSTATCSDTKNHHQKSQKTHKTFTVPNSVSPHLSIKSKNVR